MERDDCGRGVSGEGEDGFRGARGGRRGVLRGDSGEGGGFAGLHVDAAEVDGAAEGALDGGLEEVEFAHGDAAGGDDDVDAGEGGAEGGFEGAGSKGVSGVGWEGRGGVLV